MDDSVTFQVTDNIGIICLNRPLVHNAVNAAMMARLETILDAIEDQPGIRVLILTGAGSRSFCSGGDLEYFASLDNHEDGLAMSQRMKLFLKRLADGPRPLLAAVNGATLGGGCEILVACHLRLTVSTAHFSFRQAAMGVVTGWGGGARMFDLLSHADALRLFLTAEQIDAYEARRIGLVDFVVDSPERLMDEALDLAGRIAANAPRSIAGFLELARTHRQAGSAAVDRRETELFAQEWGGDHFRNRVAEWPRRRKTRR